MKNILTLVMDSSAIDRIKDTPGFKGYTDLPFFNSFFTRREANGLYSITRGSHSRDGLGERDPSPQGNFNTIM